jgi:hypothetical protein
MKVVFYGESPADQAAIAVFTEGILGSPLESIDLGLEAHGVSSVLNTLDGVFRGVYYRSDAEGLVVVVDSDNTPMHESAHDNPGGRDEDCRHCKLRRIIARARNQLKPRQGRPELKVAIGLAVPEIEAWYLVGKTTELAKPLGELVWLRNVHRFPDRNSSRLSTVQIIPHWNSKPNVQWRKRAASSQRWKLSNPPSQ